MDGDEATGRELNVAKGSVRDLLRVPPGTRLPLEGVDPRSTPGVRTKKDAGRQAAKSLVRLWGLQERLYAEGTRSVLVVLQGMDTSGKDGTVRHVFAGLNPAGVNVTGFKTPTDEERRHGFLWRIRRALPGPGDVGIFNRSHYEDVLIVRVHELVPEPVWQKRYGQINRFESEVAAAGTTVLKCCLHISYEEQRSRILARLEDPTKRWKFKERDLEERKLWSDYQAAYEAALERCSTDIAPWYLVPSDRKWYRNWAIGRMLVETLEEMDPRYPQPKLDIDALEGRLAPPN
jgi:PPK2 family polyphosphate:nucleotide phosphotransferase